MKNGSRGTIEVATKCPMSVFGMLSPYPPTRSSTLATLDEVSTVTVSASPACGVVELSCTHKICGAASDGSMRTVGVGIGVADGSGEIVGAGESDGIGDPGEVGGIAGTGGD
jgi:hypothetical protein